jgi:AAA domain
VAQTAPPKSVINGLIHEAEIAGLHGAPEVFKTVFSLQLAESLASATPLLGIWQVPTPQTVYFFETEMSVPALGLRLAKMFAQRTPPAGIHFADEARLRLFRRAPDLKSKFSLLGDWVAEAKAKVLILDTCNPFFRGKESPNDETTAGAFFDLLEAMPASVKLFVRHNHKPRIDDPSGDAATKIRGSGQFSDVSDLLLELRRMDKRTNEAALSISKFRHGTKPDDLRLWLDATELRLVSLPPVIYLLQAGARSRCELLEGLAKRFGIQQRAADSLIKAEQRFLKERLSGHKLIYEIDWNAAPDAEWSGRVQAPRETVEDMQGCISHSLSPRNVITWHDATTL